MAHGDSNFDPRDLIGTKSGHLTVIDLGTDLYNKDGTYSKHLKYKCECDCPDHTITYVKRDYILRQSVTSCGCGRYRKVADPLVETHAKFGRLTVMELAKPILQKYKPRKTNWNPICKVAAVKCKCDCGNEVIVELNKLISGNTRSCGCLAKDVTRAISTKHGLTNSRIYYIYHGMIDRCFNSNNDHYQDYGGRGITICDEWYPNHDSLEGFKAFYNWAIHNGYYEQDIHNTIRGDRLSIDRIDVNGNYCPENCRWIPLRQQPQNVRKNGHIHDGEEDLIYSDFCRKYNLDWHFVISKLGNNWTLNAIVYAAKHPELMIHRTCFTKEKNYYIDKDGFQVLIPRIPENDELEKTRYHYKPKIKKKK